MTCLNNLELNSVPPFMSLLRLFLAAILTTFASAEKVTLITGNRSQSSSRPALSSKSITLEAEDIATALYVSNNAFIDITVGGTVIRLDANSTTQITLPVIAGPAMIRIANFNSTNASLATFSIKRASDPETRPSGVVVIPDDGSGDREVHLESSADLVTWIPTQTGLFNSANASRFFRVRVTKRPTD